MLILGFPLLPQGNALTSLHDYGLRELRACMTQYLAVSFFVFVYIWEIEGES